MRESSFLTTLYLVDDDEDFYFLVKEALEDVQYNCRLLWMKEPKDLFAALGKAEGGEVIQRAVIMLDLNIPKINGYEVLKTLKTDAGFKKIPVIVLTTSNSEDDVIQSYGLGANAFITKPADFTRLVALMRAFGNFWLETAILPVQGGAIHDKQK